MKSISPGPSSRRARSAWAQAGNRVRSGERTLTWEKRLAGSQGVVSAEGEGVEAGDLPRWAEDHLLSAADLREEVVGDVVMERGEVVAGAEPEIDLAVLVLVDEGGKTDIGPELGQGGPDGQ